jgi:hypothetical protein
LIVDVLKSLIVLGTARPCQLLWCTSTNTSKKTMLRFVNVDCVRGDLQQALTPERDGNIRRYTVSIFFKYKTYAAVLKSRKNRLLCALAASMGWSVHRTDITTQAFTYGHLDPNNQIIQIYCRIGPLRVQGEDPEGLQQVCVREVVCCAQFVGTKFIELLSLHPISYYPITATTKAKYYHLLLLMLLLVCNTLCCAFPALQCSYVVPWQALAEAGICSTML